MSCDRGCRRGLEPELLWLWHRLAAAALIQHLAWEHPYATGASLKRKKKNEVGTHQVHDSDYPSKGKKGPAK